MQLQPHQLNNAALLLRALGKHGGVLDASETGTGKTPTAVGLCREINAQPGIICPLPCIPSWRDTCEVLGVKPAFIVNYEGCKSKNFEFGQLDVTYKVSRSDPEKKTKTAKYAFRNLPPRTIMIFDEVQRCRSPKSENSQILLAAAKDYKTLLLSATPFQDPTEAFPIGRALRLFSVDGFFRWQLQHGVRKNVFGRWEFQGTAKDLEKIHAAIFPERGVRTRRSEIPGFPESLIIARAVETGAADEIAAKYLEIIAEARVQDYVRAREGVAEEFHEFVEPLAITRGLRARQEVELLKISTMAEMARDAVDRGMSVPIFLNFDASIELMREILKTDCILRGARPGGGDNLKREACIQAFQRNQSPYIIVNSQAGGAGVNLHDPVSQKPRHALISPPWSAIVLRQVLGRSHRNFGGYSTQEMVFAAGTIEERVRKAVQDNIDNLDLLTDGHLSVVDDLLAA